MKSKNGRTTNQDYMNLLYSESESGDEPPIPDLKLPPLTKTKKTRKKRGGLSLRGGVGGDVESGGAILGVSCLKITVVVVLLISVSVFGVLGFWLLNQVSQLKDQIKTVESEHKKSNEQMIKLQSDYKQITQTVEQLKTERVKLIQNITSLTDKYTKLTAGSVNSGKGISDNTNILASLVEIPKKFDTLSQTTASMGSDVVTLKEQIKGLEDLKKRVEVLETKMNSNEGHMVTKPTNQTLISPNMAYFEQKLNVIHHDMDLLNQTISKQAQLLNGTIITRVGLLETSVSTLIKDMHKLNTSTTPTVTEGGAKPANLRPQISAIIQEMIKSGDIKLGDGESVNSLRLEVANLTSLLAELLNNHSQLLSDHSQMLSVNQSLSLITLTNQTKTMNVSVIKLQSEVDQLFSKITSNTNTIHQVRMTVDGLKQYLADHHMLSMSNGASSKGTTPSSNKGTTPASNKGTTPASNKGTSTLVSVNSPTTQAPKKSTITLPGITSYHDLQVQYDKWTSKTTNKNLGIPLSELSTYMPDSSIPKTEVMKAFDKNNDNLFSIDEWAQALGLSKSEPPEGLPLS